jgi:hypothetical protein
MKVLYHNARFPGRYTEFPSVLKISMMKVGLYTVCNQEHFIPSAGRASTQTPPDQYDGIL